MEDLQLSTFGELLKAFRKQRKMAQRELAVRIGAHRNTIGSWERGDVLPESKTVVLDVAAQLRLDTQETRRLLEASLTALSPYWLIPSPRNPFFTGREDVLRQLHAALAQEYTAVLSQSYALSGLGGIGKTQTVIEYAYRHANDYAAVFWISAETQETIITSIVAIATLLNLPETQEHNQEKVAAAVTRWMSNHRDWLLILDNVEDPALVKRFLPPARCGSLLFTSRRQVLGLAGKILDLEQMTSQEGLRFLLHRSRRLDPTISLADFPPTEKAFAQEIVATMDGLPLALEQAGAYIEETKCSFEHYHQLYQNYRGPLLARRGAQTANYPDSVATTWSLSFQQIEQANPAATELLRLCAFLAPDHIPEELLIDGAPHWPPLLQQVAADPFAFDQMLETLLSFSLVKRLAENHLLSIHRLVQVVQLERMDPEEQRQWAERVVFAVSAVFPRDPKNEIATWPLCLRYLEQAQVCNTLLQQWELMLSEGADLLERTGSYLHERAFYAEAEPLYRRALHIWEQSLGSEHSQVATPLYKLAQLYRGQGKYAEAEPLYRRALHIWEQSLGSEHSQLALSLNGLATLYNDQGKYMEAEPLFRRALHIWEQSLGPEHLRVAYPLNSLAILYAMQGKYAEAEPLFQRALRIWEQSFGPEHPEVAFSLNNLAELYTEQGKYEEAEPLGQRALHIREQSLGPEHPQVGYTLTVLASLYYKQGKYAEAEPLFQRALRICEQSFGPKHPQVSYILTGLASIYKEQGKYAEAESLFQRALHIREHALEADHPDIADTLYGFADLREAQGKIEEAVSLYCRALTIREKVYDQQHSKIIATREHLHALLQAMDKTEDVAVLEMVHLDRARRKDERLSPS